MAANSKSHSATIRAGLNHPVIDSDGHHVEYFPRLRDYIREVAGSGVADRVGRGFDGTIAGER